MTTNRSNKQTEVVFVADNGTTHADRVHGNGFGAFVKMADRASVAVTGWTTLDTRTTFDGVKVTWTNRRTGQSVTADFMAMA